MKKCYFAASLAAALITTISTGTLLVQAADPEYSIGIVQLNQVDLLDDVTLGFEEAIMDGLGSDNVLFDEKSAEGDPTNYASIMNGFVSENSSLIFACSDDMLAAAAAATSEIPIIGTCIYNLSAASGSNTAGISALAPYGEQTDLLRTILPDAKTVGIVYSEGNAFSEEQVNGMNSALFGAGLTVTAYPFSDNIESAITAAADACDVIYVPVDAQVTANAAVISSVCTEKQKPVITGDEGTCALCGLAVSTTNAYELGYEAGQLAVDVLNGNDISSIGMKSPSIRLRKYNEETADALGISVPDDFESIETVSVESENDGIEEMTNEQIAEAEAEMAKQEG